MLQPPYNVLLVLDLAARYARGHSPEELLTVLGHERKGEEAVQVDFAPDEKLQVLDVVRLRSVVVGNATADLGYP